MIIIMFIVIMIKLIHVCWNIIIALLYSLSKLKELSELVLHGNEFTGGLPSVIGELRTLKVLHIDLCKLVELPIWYVQSRNGVFYSPSCFS